MLMSKAPLMSFCRHLAGPIYRLLFPATASGLENYRGLDRYQPLIIVANHPGHHDPLQLIVHTNRNLHFLAKKELFNGPFGWFFRALGLVKVDRDSHESGVSQAEQYLRDKQVVAIFPEGTTKFKQLHQILPFKYGAIRLARDTSATILPVAIVGQPKLFRRHCHLQFGTPYTAKPNTDLDAATHQLEQNILELMRQAGCENATLLPGKPANNPSSRPPIV